MDKLEHSVDYDVILCTYNGAYFISQQLESILMQSVLPARIIISDDNSSDDTIEIIKSTCDKFGYAGVEIYQGMQKGVIYNFLSAISYASGDYIFLADQDDIWLPNKAEEFLKAFNDIDKSKPSLVFSDALLIDENNNKIAESFFSYQGISSKVMEDDSILYRNCVQGASCAINKALQKLVADSLFFVEIKNLYMHDWWIALLARYYGNYKFINQPLLAYRQHTHNQVGVFNNKLRFVYYVTRFKIYLKNFKKAISQVWEFEKFSSKYSKLHSILVKKQERNYQWVSKIKLLIIKLFSL